MLVIVLQVVRIEEMKLLSLEIISGILCIVSLGQRVCTGIHCAGGDGGVCVYM